MARSQLRQTPAVFRGAASPFALGHEFAGVVAEAGANVSHVHVGDRVVVNPMEGGNDIGSGGIKGAFAPYLVFFFFFFPLSQRRGRIQKA
ncbi:MAG: alcohol dehydrogenase catalytic domain-containing protein [Cellvibrionales bacterium]|nr:alcohol dehydrogenase catalytic domain-containing protein [Cellvibrionales bacterium]